MEDLIKLQSELSEFFCEDSKTFKLEECFKSFCQFIGNFKKAANDNDKRREQEKSAELRRQQRETEQAKRRSGSFQGRVASSSRPVVKNLTQTSFTVQSKNGHLFPALQSVCMHINNLARPS